MKAAGTTLIAAAMVLGLASPAQAWSPGPYSFARCMKEFGTAARGKVIKVSTVGKRPGGWVLSRATLRVAKTYGMKAQPKNLSFYFWSGTDNRLTIAHSIAKGEELLVFLSRDIAPIRGYLPVRSKPVGFFLRFAKANHRGYLFKIQGTIMRDAIMQRHTIPTRKAMRLLRTR